MIFTSTCVPVGAARRVVPWTIAPVAEPLNTVNSMF
jgi:hypothetical protein